MKRTALLTFVSVGLVLGTVTAINGCSSSSSDAAPANVKRAPAKPSGPATSDTSTKTFAVQTLYLGDAPRSGAANPDAWKKFGYDLDGKVTSKDSSDVCQLPAGAQRIVKEDGDDGIDNSFGHNLLPVILGASPTAAADLNKQLAKGAFTLMFTVSGLADGASQTATGLKGYLNAGSAFDPSGQKSPTFTTADDWPVIPELLSNPSDPASSKTQFSDAYVMNGTFVNGSDAKITITLGFNGQNLDLNIYKAVVTFDHKDPSTAANGVIAGILNTEEFIGGLQRIAGQLQANLCSGDQLKTITDQIRSMSDIMANGTQDPSKTCDGISIGLGFDAKQIMNPTKVGPSGQGTPTGCGADAGPDGSVAVDSGSPTDAGNDSASPTDAGTD